MSLIPRIRKSQHQLALKFKSQILNGSQISYNLLTIQFIMSRPNNSMLLNFAILPNAYRTQIEELREKVNNNAKRIQEQRKRQELLQELLGELSSVSEASSRGKLASSKGKQRQSQSGKSSSRSYGTDLGSHDILNQFAKIKQFMNEYQEEERQKQKQYENKATKVQTFSKNNKYLLENRQTIKPWRNAEEQRKNQMKEDQDLERILWNLKKTITTSLQDKRRLQYQYDHCQKLEKRKQMLQKQRSQIREEVLRQMKAKEQAQSRKSQTNMKRILNQKFDKTMKYDANESAFPQNRFCASTFLKNRKNMNKLLTKAQHGSRACQKIKLQIFTERSVLI